MQIRYDQTYSTEVELRMNNIFTLDDQLQLFEYKQEGKFLDIAQISKSDVRPKNIEDTGAHIFFVLVMTLSGE